MRLIRIVALSVLLTFVFNALLVLIVGLIGGNADTPSGRTLLGAELLDVTGADWVWVILLWGLALMQSCLLLLPLPVASAPGAKVPLGPRVLAAAFLGGLFIAIPIFATLDMFQFSDKPADAQAFDPMPLFYGVLGVWALSWLIWTPILLHRSRGQADAVERFVGKNIAGSAVGLALCLPWYYVLRRKQSCFCGLGTFWALVLGLWSLLVIGGPLLFVLARDRRIRASLRQS